MTKGELQDIIESHKKWLNGYGGERANLCGADLSDTDLRNVNLHHALLIHADLCNANLSGIDLCGVDLSDARLCNADLSCAIINAANLSYADLSGANLCYTNLCNTDLHNANISDANLSGANLSRANLRGTDLSKLIYDEDTAFCALQCPETGSFIGYKKAHGYIVELEILADAKRSSATSRKCRCSAAKVLSITTISGKSTKVKEIASNRDSNFVYRVGEIVRVDCFDENRWNECSTGIHFFITRSEAERYGT
jgi:uncharacterized protein YjbI with pentapeptide repeats